MAFEDDLIASLRLEKALSKPSIMDRAEIGMPEFFDPWGLFDAFAGARSPEMDALAIWTLESMLPDAKCLPSELQLAAQFFGNMLIGGKYADLDHKSRRAVPNAETNPLWSELIAKWRTYFVATWGEDCQALPPNVVSRFPT